MREKEAAGTHLFFERRHSMRAKQWTGIWGRNVLKTVPPSELLSWLKTRTFTAEGPIAK